LVYSFYSISVPFLRL